jgi:glycosyltransferase involved in cell wall biosynthesis
LYSPKVSLLMSVYDGAEYLRECIDSILAQSFCDYELIIIDDCAVGKVKDLLSSYSDGRIKIIRNEVNLGLTKSLNKALRASRAPYVARIDHDDICFSGRLQSQIDFMESHPSIGISGSWARGFGTKEFDITPPVDHDHICATLLYYNCYLHSSLIMRRLLLERYGLMYDENMRYAQDYDLLARSSQLFMLANQDEFLIMYRYHAEQITSTKSDQQNALASQIRITLWQQVFPSITHADIAVVNRVVNARVGLLGLIKFCRIVRSCKKEICRCAYCSEGAFTAVSSAVLRQAFKQSVNSVIQAIRRIPRLSRSQV